MEGRKGYVEAECCLHGVSVAKTPAFIKDNLIPVSDQELPFIERCLQMDYLN